MVRRRERVPGRHWWATSLALGVLQLVSSAATAGQVSRRFVSGEQASLSGRISDQLSGVGVASAHVTLTPLPGRGDVVWEGLTDNDGRFTAESVPPGTYEVRVTKPALSSITAGLSLRESEHVSIDVGMVPEEVVELDPVVVIARGDVGRGEAGGRLWPSTQGAQDILGVGGISALGVQRVADLFYRIPGTTVIADGQGRAAEVVLRNGCVPQVVVDGVPFSFPVRLDEVVNVHELESLEVYKGKSAAVRFSNSSCGTIMAWTRRYARSNSQIGWPKAVVALGFFGGFLAIGSLF